MTSLSIKRNAVFAVIFTLFFSLACITVTGDQSDGGNPADDASSSQDFSIDGEFVFGPGDLIFPDPAAGLSGLSSYKSTLTISFDGTHDGNGEIWSKTYVFLRTVQPAAWSMIIDQNTSAEGSVHLLKIGMDGMEYNKTMEEACVANILQQSVLLDEPAALLSGVMGAEDVGADTVNNIAVEHYIFDQSALGPAGLAESTGELWVAAEGGYLVKYLLNTKAGSDYLGEGFEGTVTWDYQLSEANAIASIDLPADCPPALADNIPVLPDASDVQKLIGLMSYTTASAPKDVAAFYQEQMQPLSWAPQGNQGASDKSAFVIFTQGTKSLFITADAHGTTTKVKIVVSTESSSGQ